MMKLLIGGSPCTHWSIAQTKNRETKPEGMGWELFKNYLIALEKFKPDFFLYENNKSMASAIREQITKELGVEPICINSALVSAQNRQRLYWVGKRNPDGTYSTVPIEQPEDRGILLRDVLESTVQSEKGYFLAEPVGVGYRNRRESDGKLYRRFETSGNPKANALTTVQTDSMVAEPLSEPVNANDLPFALTATYNGATPENTIERHQRTMVAEPVPLTEREMEYMVRETKNGRNHFDYGYIQDGTKDKANCITANIHRGVPYNVCAEPVRIGTIESTSKNADYDSQQYRVYSPDDKSVTLCGQGGGIGAKTGLYAVPFNPTPSGKSRVLTSHYCKKGTSPNSLILDAIPNPERPEKQLFDFVAEGVETPACLRYVRSDTAKKLRKAYESGVIKHGYHEFHELHPREDGKTNTLSTVQKDNLIIEQIFETTDGKVYPVYEVRGGMIAIKDKWYPVKLADGFYIIRKLTVRECMRLQTVPEWYEFPVSNSQSYKMLGNGWTVDVIAHLLAHCDGITDNPLTVLSMYDGMSCGHIALDKLGAHIERYYATEIDKYAIKATQHNYPDTIQLGDAFQVREEGWTL